MVDILISVRNFVDQPATMAFSINSDDICSKLRQNNHASKNRKALNSQNCQNIPDCHRSRSAAVDVLILIAVMCAFGFLLYPYIMLLCLKFAEFFVTFVHLVREEVSEAPMIYASLGASLSCVAMAAFGIVICFGNKCGNPNCKGLRKAAEFDIQLETEGCVKNSNSKDDGKKSLFELPRDYHRELETELKKIAPPNGRAVLVFRARCGCSVGRLEVPGPKKQRKIKK